MKPWLKWTLGTLLAAILAFGAFAAMSTYFVLRHLETKSVSAIDTRKDFDAIRQRFAGRAPMIEVVDFEKGDVRIQRVAHPEGREATTIHVMAWKEEDGHLITTDMPLWLMRFSTVNVVSRLGIAPERFRLTAEDLKRFGPGIVVDYNKAKSPFLIWVE